MMKWEIALEKVNVKKDTDTVQSPPIIAFAQEGYMAIGWRYEISYRPLIAMQIIREEINNYDGIK